MPAGFEAYDEQARLVISLTSRLSRIVGYASVNAGQSGQVSVNPALGEPWFFFVNTGRFARVSINASTGVISWDNTGIDNMVMMYGVR